MDEVFKFTCNRYEWAIAVLVAMKIGFVMLICVFFQTKRREDKKLAKEHRRDLNHLYGWEKKFKELEKLAKLKKRKDAANTETDNTDQGNKDHPPSPRSSRSSSRSRA